MLKYLTRGQVAVGAALALPPAVCAVLVPFRADMPDTNTVLVTPPLGHFLGAGYSR
ncbi:hypothetical protein [Streptomyces sp. NPDC002215]|uniref:hypothetical protein n=1 Tax=Streptomyces sp. NPDC002215 TaxID=3154412 RepID=UPI00332A9B7F